MATKKENPKTVEDDHYGVYDTDVAMMLDLNCAAVYSLLKGWIKHNQNNNQNFHDGRYWTFNSVKAWSLDLPFLSEKQIRIALEKLENAGLVITGNYNKKSFDRTKWYSVNPPPNRQMQLPNRANVNAPEGNTIPIINTIINETDINDDDDEGDKKFSKNNNQDIAKVFKSYESEIGVLTSLIGNEIKAFLEQDNVSPDWIVAAIEEASRNNARSWSYVSAIIKRWQVDGFQSTNKPEAKPKSKPPFKKPKYDMGDYEVSHESEVLYDFGDKDFIKGDDREIPF